MALVKSKKKIVSLITLVFICLLIIQITSRWPDNNFKKSEIIEKKAIIKISNHVLKAEVAESPRELYQGLSNRDFLCSDCAMLFNFKESTEQIFVMRKMKFPLDIIFINRGKIISIASNLSPDNEKISRYYSSRGNSNQVLEVNAGYAIENSLQIGDSVEMEIINN